MPHEANRLEGLISPNNNQQEYGVTLPETVGHTV